MKALDLLRLPAAQVVSTLGRIRRRGREWLLQSLFAAHGRNLRFDPDGELAYGRIHLGDDVILGRGACLLAAESDIVVGNKVMFGPGVVIVAGNHNTSVVGRAMFDVIEKRPIDDQDVVIEDEVWVGARAVILKGVVVGRGAIVGAGAVVTHPVPPYGVVAGNPAKLIRFRFSVDQILVHERALYPVGKRLTRPDLDRIQGQVPGPVESKAAHAVAPSVELAFPRD